ncbi:MAG: hypothetical protein ACFCU1_04670 [Sumerlaeia bacterium]
MNQNSPEEPTAQLNPTGLPETDEQSEKNLALWEERLRLEAKAKNPTGAYWIPFSAWLITLLLGLMLANARPYFHDEAATWYYSGFSMLQLFDKLSGDVHPPLYFLTSWLLLLSNDLFTLRVFSVLCGSLTVAIISVRAVQSLPQSRAWMLSFLLCTSPFLIFLFHFARYYSFVCLLVTGTALAVERYIKSQRRFDCFMVGLMCSLLFLTNYAVALLIAVPTLIILVGWNLWKQESLNLVLALVPTWVTVLAWMPFLLSQFGDGFDGRTTTAAGDFLRGFVLNGGYMVFSFGASDALPPWTIGGLTVAALNLIAFGWGFIICLRHSGKTRLMCVAVLAMLIASAVIGAVIMKSAGFIFFPARVGWVYLLWFAVAVGIPLAINKAPQGLLVICGVCNGIGMVALLGTSTTTVWAYQVPNQEIAAYVTQLKNQSPNATVLVNMKSLGNIAYELEKQTPAINQGPCPPQGDIILVGEASAPAWPPYDAVRNEDNCNPFIPYVQTEEQFFLSENNATVRAKQRFLKRDVLKEKLVVRKFSFNPQIKTTPTTP